MSLSITVSGDTVQEIRNGLLQAANVLGGGAEVATDAMDGLDVPTPKGKPGRPAKAKSAADMAADLGLEAPAPAPVEKAAAAPAITEAQMKATMQGLMAERTGDTVEAGRDRVIKALGTIGCKTVREVKPEQYAALVKNASLI